MKLPTIQLTQKPTIIRFTEDIDIFSLFERIEQEHEHCFILESLGEYSDQSRYTVIGFSPDSIIQARGNVLTIDGTDYPVDNPYYALREIVPPSNLGTNYAGGLVGYLGYDAIPYFEPSLSIIAHPDFPQFMFGVYTDGIIFDKRTDEFSYFFYHTNRFHHIKKLLTTPPRKKHISVKYQSDSMTQAQHAKAVEKVKEHIKAGDTFQCQVGLKAHYHISGDTLAIYEQLRTVNPSPYMYYVKFGKRIIIGASPELLFRMRNGVMETFPLAGTIRRGKDDKEDKHLARKLLQDPKEIAEHNMLVDLHRNDIGRVAEFGSVKVRDLMDIKKFSHVQHISSEITGILKDGHDMFSALASNFPAGTLSGAPKIESMKIIDRSETEPRGPYGGALGHFGFNGDCTFAIPIRTLFINETRAFIQASGGIVYDSIAAHEYDEVQRKLKAMKVVLESFT